MTKSWTWLYVSLRASGDSLSLRRLTRRLTYETPFQYIGTLALILTLIKTQTLCHCLWVCHCAVHFVLKLFWNCSETVQKLFWNCSETVLKLFRNCSETVLKLFRNCSETVLKLFRNCSETVHIIMVNVHSTITLLFLQISLSNFEPKFVMVLAIFSSILSPILLKLTDWHRNHASSVARFFLNYIHT